MKKLLLLTASILLFVSYVSAQYSVGDRATDFSLKNVDGKYVSLKNYDEAKGYIVIFTCNHCPYSKLYENRIIAIDKKYRKKGFPVIAINPNDPENVPEDSYENMVIRAKKKKYEFPYLFDETQEIAKTYGATRTPHVFLLKKYSDHNEVVYIGAIDDNAKSASDVNEKYLENAIDAVMKGEQVDPSFTKAIGCTVKWKAE